VCANRRARILLPEHRFKRPESVLVVVYTTGGEFLLLRRRSPSAFWQSVTGSLRWGESPLQAARRELYEETGIMAGSLLNDLRHTERFPIVPPWRSRYSPNARFNTEHWFSLLLPARRMPILSAHEHDDYVWLPAKRAQRKVSSWTNRAAIEVTAASLYAQNSRKVISV